MERRRFIVTAFSAAAVGAVLANDACSSSVGVSPAPPGPVPPGPHVYTLRVGYTTTNIGGRRLRTRTYDGTTVGPMLETHPGSTLSVRVVNTLPRVPSEQAPRSADIPVIQSEMQAMSPTFVPRRRVRSMHINPMNNPHGYNVTNLHVHGLQTIPHLFQPLGTSDPKAPMIEIRPGQSYLYNFPIPADHPSGLHWYHPHKHGSTDVQVSGGMAGLIVVRGPIDKVPEIAAAREVFVVVQTLNVNPVPGRSNLYEREYIAYRRGDDGGYRFGTQFTMMTVNGQGVCWIDNSKTTPKYHDLEPPSFNVAPGEVIRLRFLNGTNMLPLPLALPGFEAWQIGFDGVNLLAPLYKDMSGAKTPLVTAENMFSAPVRLTMSGNRIELLLQAPQTAGTYTLSSLATKGVEFDPHAKFDLMRFVVSGSPVKMGIPVKLPKPTREYPVITDADIVRTRTFTFNQGTPKDFPEIAGLLTGFGFVINGLLYDEFDATTRPKVGTCEEWRIENAVEAEAHSFHLHANSFQLIAVNDVPNDPMEVWDTFVIPPKHNGKNGSITIRVRFVQWYGKTVFHCHILPHEDTGMMKNILMS